MINIDYKLKAVDWKTPFGLRRMSQNRHYSEQADRGVFKYGEGGMSKENGVFWPFSASKQFKFSLDFWRRDA